MTICKIIPLLLLCAACSTKQGEEKISDDPGAIERGEVVFTQQCSSCHNFSKDGIGPQLGGVTTATSASWLHRFITNPQAQIESGDERATALYHKFGTYMPSFSFLSDSAVTDIIAFLNTHREKGKPIENGDFIRDPIPDKIKESTLVVDLKLLTQIPASSENTPHTRINKLTFIPGTHKKFVADLRGKLYELRDKPEIYLDIKAQRTHFIDAPGLATGLGSIAFHPDFLKNGLFYTTHTESPGSGKADFGYNDSIKVTVQWVVTEWKADHPDAPQFAGTSRELLRVNMVSGIHGLQEVTFNPLSKRGDPDYALLYISVGDGGSAENGYPFLEHSRARIWGTIIRIDPAGTNGTHGHYGIPPGNPFARTKGDTLKEIYAYGFRNPHRISWNQDGRMLTSNIGQHNIESVNVVLPGHDYGWPLREGPFAVASYEDLEHVVALPGNDSVFHFTYPVAQYDHDEGSAISGGFDYGGKTIPALTGKYLFGDIPSGRLFYINMSDVGTGKMAPVYEWHVSWIGKRAALSDLCGDKRVDLRFGKDENGELYILTKPDGKVYRMISAHE